MRRLIRLIGFAIAGASVVAAIAACGSTVPPTPTPIPCWIGFVGEYRLTGTGAAAPTQTQLEDAARTTDARLRSMGVAEMEVTVRPPDVITVQLPRMGGIEDARALITSPGDILFVPVPTNTGVVPGDPMPAGAVPLFGRQGVSSATPGTDEAGRPAIDIVLTAQASSELDAHAAAHLGEQLAIVADGVVVTAPTLNARSFGGQLQISGANEAEIGRLVAVLRLPPIAGTLQEVSFTEVQASPGCNAVG